MQRVYSHVRPSMAAAATGAIRCWSYGIDPGQGRGDRAAVGTALVTGASSGIGAELATMLAADGYHVCLLARDESRLRAVAGALSRTYAIRCTAIQADLTDRATADELFASLPEVDVLINSAGFGVYGRFAATDEQTELDILDVNVRSLTVLTKRYLPGMIARGRGRIMNVASMAALMPGPFMSVYYATKAYVLSFSEALAAETQGTGVTVTAFCPGSTRTRFEATAGAEPSGMYRGRVMDARSVARSGYRGMMRGRPVVFAGALNSFLAACLGVTPRDWVRWSATRWNRPLD